MRGRPCLCWLSVLVVAIAVPAQEKLEIEGPEPATIRLGDSARALIRVEGRGAEPRTPPLPRVDGLELQLSPPSRNSYTFFDGRTLTERVGVQYQLVLRPHREGTFVVPPFAIWTGTREQMTRELRIDARKDLRGEELGWLDVTVEPQRVYVHEPIRIHVDYGVQAGLRLVQDVHNRYQFTDIEVQAPWLFEFPGGEPIELPVPRGDLRLVVGNPRLLLQATYEANYERGGERWQHFSFDRAFLPTRLGKIELSPPTLRYHVLQREGLQDIFGRGRGQLSDNFYVYGKPITIEVLPIPEAGRPTPYYGAVGRFQIDAALDRDTVSVGSSVKLTVTVGGQGNFEFLRLPPLDELAGFHKLGQTETKREPDKVVVTYDLAPLSTDVRAVPSIAWNYFDTTPGVEKFVEVRTRELPLVVKPLLNGETLVPLPEAAVKAVTPGVDDIFDLPSFDGANTVSAPAPKALWWGAVLGPWALALAGLYAFAAWRRAAADKQGQRARGAARACSRALEHGEDPTAVLASYLGARIGVPAAAIIAPDLRDRLVQAGLDAALAGEVASLVERGTAARYGGGTQLEPAAVRDFVKRLEPVRFGVRGFLPFLLWPVLVLGTGGGLSAQAPSQHVPDQDAAVAAYRAGDYRAAEAAFARVFAATGDRRCWQARGNCFYRLGDLPAALWAYESARLGLPRDAELLANLRLVRTRLELDVGPGGFAAELTTLRDQLLPCERLWLCAGCMAIAAGCLVLGWRRVGLRWIGVLVFVPGAWLALEALWLAPMRPVHAIARKPLALLSEPRLGLEPVATVRAGVTVGLLGGGQGTFVRVQAGDRSGYTPRESVAVVE
ncbi:MAG TPA: BatD family protein [Planctomycetota bacterium]|nr:BatD family protein [Planctomycetota bacterium]